MIYAVITLILAIISSVLLAIAMIMETSYKRLFFDIVLLISTWANAISCFVIQMN